MSQSSTVRLRQMPARSAWLHNTWYRTWSTESRCLLGTRWGMAWKASLWF